MVIPKSESDGLAIRVDCGARNDRLRVSQADRYVRELLVLYQSELPGTWHFFELLNGHLESVRGTDCPNNTSSRSGIAPATSS